MTPKDNVMKICEKAIKTTMIGAISSLEDSLGHLWAHESIPSNEQEQYMKEIFTKIRSEILGNGNDQIRNVITELENYNITQKNKSINIPLLKGTGNV